MDNLIKIFDYFFEEYKEFKIKYSRCVGLTPVECNFITHVDRNGIPMKEIARKLNLSASRTTRIADSLVKKRLIERCLSNNDRRSFIVKLTEKGEKICNEENRMCTRLESIIEKEFTPQEKQQVEDILRRFIKITKKITI
jgi:DNA-binding MarR family transcriptional regulator